MKASRSLAIAATSIVAACLVAPPQAAASTPPFTSIVLDDVELRSGVTSDLHVRVYTNPDPHCDGHPIFALHGALTTSGIFGPLAEKLFAGRPDDPVCKIAALDLPGHGMSSNPTGALFGQLTLEDYASAVRGALVRLKAYQIKPRGIVTNSMGGLILQMVQQGLIDEGSSLREEFNIKRALMIGPVPARPIPYFAVDSGISQALAAATVFSDPVLGPIQASTPELARLSCYTNFAGALVPNTPTVEEMVANGYINVESGAAITELATITPSPTRPEVDPGIFGESFGTKLEIVGYSDDAFTPYLEVQAAYQYLTGDATFSRFTGIVSSEAVHCMIMSNPQAVADAIQLF